MQSTLAAETYTREYAGVVQQLDHAHDNHNNEQRRGKDLDRQVKEAQRQLQVVEHYARPFTDAVTAAETSLAAGRIAGRCLPSSSPPQDDATGAS